MRLLVSGAKSLRNLLRAEDSETHRVLLASDSAQVRHLRIVEQLVASLHLRSLQHLEVVHGLISIITVESTATVVPVTRSLVLESW